MQFVHLFGARPALNPPVSSKTSHTLEHFYFVLLQQNILMKLAQSVESMSAVLHAILHRSDISLLPN